MAFKTKVSRDFMLKEGALELAAQVKAFWTRLGHTSVTVWVEEHPGPARQILWVVRSNLINGMPHGLTQGKFASLRSILSRV